jgi:NAD(P)-dependent dehydrogenase (short-subunit alcohol dehydrogenase family)
MPPSESSPSSSPSVLVTGASTGIGEACALELDRRGFRVFAGVRRDEDAEQLRQKASARLLPVMLDVTNADSIAAAVEVVRAALGRQGLLGLVNNAGLAVPGPLELLPIDQLRRQFEVNVFGQIAVTQAFLPMLRLARGRIVMMSSISGRVAAPFVGPYAASKHALEALSDSLRVELRRWGITVSLIEPGNVKTPIWEKSRAWAQEMAQQIPPQGDQLYGLDLRAVEAVTAKMALRGMPVQRVVGVVVHALTARRPKTRYPVGFQTRLSIQVLKFLPVGLRDWLVRREMGLP